MIKNFGLCSIRQLRKVVRALPGGRRIDRAVQRLRWPVHAPLLHPPGHFYSSIPSYRELARDRDRIFEIRDPLGIDLETDEAVSLRDRLPEIAAEFPFERSAKDDLRYGWKNAFFSRADAVVAYCLLRQFEPARWIEVGCGQSTRMLLDSIGRHALETNCTFVDPMAGRLLDWMTEAERSRHAVHEARVQDLPLGLFEDLGENDVLFVDSSHVLKAGSDVQWLFFEVFPRLAPGVLIHVHDIHYPFEYPAHWFERGFAWNEAYALRALLQHSIEFDVVWFTDYLVQRHAEYVGQRMPMIAEDGVSIWLRRRGIEASSESRSGGR